jgi:MFS family permease
MMGAQSFAERTQEKPPPFWSNPASWIKEQNLGRGYWVFFFAAFFYDAGFSVYFFLFNLYLLDRGFNDRSIGLIGGALTLGSLVGTLPAGALASRIGLRPLMAILFVAAPLVNSARVLWIWEPAQIGLAFLTGVVMSAWGVSFLPAIARLTKESNRSSAFSLIFSASVGTSMLGGVICGYLRRWLGLMGIAMQAALVKELILLVACALVLVGLFPVFRLRIPPEVHHEPAIDLSRQRGWSLRKWALSPFLLRYLPLMALWSAVLAAFTPFANIYLSRDLHVPMEHVGLVFSFAQGIQLCAGLLSPIVTRLLGLVKGIALTQAVAAVLLGCMGGARSGTFAITLYLIYSAAQWMSSPSLYNLLMNETPDRERSNAAAMTLFCNALVGSIATAGAGILFTRFGYPPVLLGLAAAGVSIALLFLFFIAPLLRTAPSNPTVNA